MHYQITNFELLRKLLESVPQDDSCMEWPRGLNKRGYGQLQTWRKDREYLVHRQAYILAIRPIEAGKNILHRCDNPKCFRPSHLFQGDAIDNMRDCASKHRTHRPTHIGPEELKEMKSLRQQGAKQDELAELFGIDQSSVSRYLNDRTALSRRIG